MCEWVSRCLRGLPEGLQSSEDPEAFDELDLLGQRIQCQHQC